jgi:hypothetical protein
MRNDSRHKYLTLHSVRAVENCSSFTFHFITRLQVSYFSFYIVPNLCLREYILEWFNLQQNYPQHVL